MYLLILPVLCLVHSVISSPISGYKPLTPEQVERLKNWKETDDENIWELSGQFEGDIILTPEQQRNGEIDLTKRWPNGEIPYMFSDDVTQSQKNVVNDALQEFVIHSCVRPILITEPVKDYVFVRRNVSGCSAALGRIGGKQNLNLGENCYKKKTVLHEFLHALGFYHQQSAQERDDYVIIHEENITPGQKFNFDKRRTDNFNTTYDYLSILHYVQKAFSKNGQITIETKDPYYQDKIGKGPGLTATDLIKLNRMYNCPEKKL